MGWGACEATKREISGGVARTLQPLDYLNCTSTKALGASRVGPTMGLFPAS